MLTVSFEKYRASMSSERFHRLWLVFFWAYIHLKETHRIQPTKYLHFFTILGARCCHIICLLTVHCLISVTRRLSWTLLASHCFVCTTFLLISFIIGSRYKCCTHTYIYMNTFLCVQVFMHFITLKTSIKLCKSKEVPTKHRKLRSVNILLRSCMSLFTLLFLYLYSNKLTHANFVF